MQLYSNIEIKMFFFPISVINQEKTIQNIEGFDKSKLKHAETTEKNPLPDKAGELIL